MITLRIPTTEQYAYIEIQILDDMPSAQTVKDLYDEYTKVMTGGVGLDSREFNRILDEYLWGSGTMMADEYGSMNLDQQSIIQCIKRSRARKKE